MLEWKKTIFHKCSQSKFIWKAMFETRPKNGQNFGLHLPENFVTKMFEKQSGHTVF